MATKTKGLMDAPEKKFRSKMEEFPCMFNMQVPNPSMARLEFLGPNVSNEVRQDKNVPDETVQSLNLITWVYYKLRKLKQATSFCDRALDLTKRKDIAALGNRAFLFWLEGKERKAETVFAELKNLKSITSDEDYNSMLIDAKANQAYCCFRIGGPKNLPRAIELYEEVLKKKPDLDLWKLGLGTVYVRAVHGNIFALLDDKPSPKNLEDRAKQLLTDVAEHAKDEILRGRAYSEMVNLVCVTKDNAPYALQLCDKAVEYGEKDAWVLSSCGRMMINFDVDKAIELLKLSLEIREHTTPFQCLGKCYVKKAQEKAKVTESNDNTSGTVRKIGNIVAVHYLEPEITLSIDEEFVELAIENYELSIEASKGGNIPAMYDLAVLLKSCGEIEDALSMFNKITIQEELYYSHVVSVAMAYEQAGLCYLELKKSVDESKQDDYQEKAEEKLMQAVSLSAQMATDITEMEDFSESMWEGFRSFQAENAHSQDPVAKDKSLMLFYNQVKRYAETVEVLKKLLSYSNAELDDPNVVECGLSSYLAQNKVEDAHAFLELVKTRKSDIWQKESLLSLHFKVSVLAAQEKLCEGRADAKVILKSLFTERYMTASSEKSCANGTSSAGDVLILYDEYHTTEDGLSATGMVAKTLRNTMMHYLDLNVDLNLDSSQYNMLVEMEEYFTEFKRHCVVVVLIGQEELEGLYKALLGRLTAVQVNCGANEVPPTILVATVGDISHHTELPNGVKTFHRISLDPIINNLPRRERKRSQVATSQGATVEGSEKKLEQKEKKLEQKTKADALLSLFCFLMGKTWPFDMRMTDAESTLAPLQSTSD